VPTFFREVWFYGVLVDFIGEVGSDVAGLMVLSRQQSSFLGGGMISNDYSEEMAQNIDKSIKSTLTERYEFVKKTLREYDGAIENMAAVLLDVEVIEGDKVQEIINAYEEEKGLESRMVHLKKKINQEDA